MIRSAGSNIAMQGYLGVRPNPIVGEPEYIAAEVLKFRELGLKHYVAGLDPCTPRSLEEFSRIMEIIDGA